MVIAYHGRHHLSNTIGGNDLRYHRCVSGTHVDADAGPEPPDAPGRLGLVEAFVNSLHMPEGPDLLATPDAARAWLQHQGFHTPRLSPGERDDLVELREALRDLLEGNAGHQVAARTVHAVMQRLNASALETVISPAGAELVARGSGVAAFTGELTAAIVIATTDGTWQRLKVCRNDSCRWAFYDGSKNGRRTWCSMRSCGCQSKARAYRARKRETSAVSA